MRQLNNRSNKEIQKEKLIREILEKNSYIPRQATIKSYLINDSDKAKYTNGISNKLSPVFFDVDESLSYKKYNDVFKTAIEDLEHIRYEYKEIDNQIEDSYRNYINKTTRYIDQLNKLELEVNRELLLSNNQDAFRYGVTEEFTDLKFIDQALTNALIYDGKVMCKPTLFQNDNENLYDIKIDSKSRSNSIVFQSALQNAFDIKQLDKTGYQHLVYSNYKNDIIDLIVDLTFPNPKDLNLMRLDLIDTGLNSKIILNVFCMTSSNVFEPIENNNIYVQNGTSFIQINREAVRNIKLVFTKTTYDEVINLEYLFRFNINYISFTNVKFDTVNESTMICGPYSIFDTDNNPINFSIATIKGGTCCEIPNTTSIDFYLSKDKVNWEPISFTDSNRSIAYFQNTKPEIIELINYEDGNYISNDTAFISSLNLSLSSSQALLNFYIPFSNLVKYIFDSAEIKRHTFSSSNDGWIKTEDKYFTTFFIEELEGRYIDFGPTPCLIDNISRSGKVFLKYGVHTIKTNQYSKIISPEAINEIELKNKDSLYPFNHKYLIEGFNYSSNYIGHRVYLGAKENYGYMMKPVSLNYLKNNPDRFDIFSAVSIQEKGLFFVVNTSVVDTDFINESYEINVLSSDSVFDNNLYIKAILKTDDKNITPKIDSVQVRVI